MSRFIIREFGGGCGVEKLSKKKKKELVDMYNSVVCGGGGGWVEVVKGIERIKGAGKK